MIDGALYKLPVLEGKLSGTGPTLFIGSQNLTEAEKELLKSLVYGPGDSLAIFDETADDITNSNESTSIDYGGSYTAILTCNPLNSISLSVYVGERNIPECITVETYCKHVINIPEANDPIRIIGTTARFIKRIHATYNQSKEIHAGTSLDELRDDLVVRGGGLEGPLYELTGYTLSGRLTLGKSRITVSFHGVTTTFDVTVT